MPMRFGNGYLGSGMHMIEEIFHHGHTAYYAFALKMLFTALTLGAGFKGGEIVPTLTVGAAFGCCVAMLFGLDVPLLAACGMVGLFCGVTNSPLTSLLLGLELFGAAGMPYYLITVAVSYLISGRESLYKQQKLLCEKTSASFSRRPSILTSTVPSGAVTKINPWSSSTDVS